MAPLLIPDWPAPPWVRAACSTREGGVSAGPYASLNLGDHVGDDESAVAENRRRYGESLQARPVYLRQVHGWRVAVLDHGTAHGTEADACVSSEAGMACTIMVADCLPVLLAHRRRRVVGAAHCGWRGLAGQGGQGALEALWHTLQPKLGAEAAQDAIAWLGPCIGPTAFEVGPEVREAFVTQDADATRCFRPADHGKFLADLPGLARRRLQALGVEAIYGNDGSGAWCTVGNPSRFFSHRRDGVSGRFAASIWLD